MSLLRVAAPLVFLVSFSASAIAAIYAPTCTSTTYTWTSNSVGQDACTIIANMMGTCNGGNYNLSALRPGYTYFGPSAQAGSNLCYCSTVGYSLFSACVACQGEDWITWSQWITNCTKTLTPGSFPNPVPAGLSVPRWVILDVTNENLWNANRASATGDSPEFGPGSIINASSLSVSVTTSVASTSSSSASSKASSTSPVPPPKGGGSSNTGAIAGGAVGGVVAIFAVAAIFFYLRRRSRARSVVAPGVRASQAPLSDESMFASSSSPVSPATMKFYDPNDPTTFPGYSGQGPPSPNNASQIGSGTTLGYTQTSLPQDRGYHGLPTV